MKHEIYVRFICTGEANAAKADAYMCSFPAMIYDWREKFHKMSQGQTSNQFPFGFVQVEE